MGSRSIVRVATSRGPIYELIERTIAAHDAAFEAAKADGRAAPDHKMAPDIHKTLIVTVTLIEQARVAFNELEPGTSTDAEISLAANLLASALLQTAALGVHLCDLSPIPWEEFKKAQMHMVPVIV